MMLLGALPAVSVARAAGVIMKKSDIFVLLLGAVLHSASTVLFCLVIASVVPRREYLFTIAEYMHTEHSGMFTGLLVIF